jgi:hypothetical protein
MKKERRRVAKVMVADVVVTAFLTVDPESGSKS